MNAPQTNTPINEHYAIKPDGWARCAHCTHEFKGATPSATLRIIAAHLSTEHGVVLGNAQHDAQHDASEHDECDSAESPFSTPYFIGPRRNGSCIMRSQRTDYGAWV